jgi:hypothetical protein
LEVKEKFQERKISPKLLANDYSKKDHSFNQSIIRESSLILQTLFAKKQSVSSQINQPRKIFINSAQIIKREIFKPWLKRAKPIYKISYQKTSGRKGYFLLDSYQKHREFLLNHLSLGLTTNLVLNQGNIYQFYLGIN